MVFLIVVGIISIKKEAGKLVKDIGDPAGLISEFVDKALFTVLSNTLQLPATYDEFRDIVVNTVIYEVKKLASSKGIDVSSISNNEILDIVNITIDSLKLDTNIENKYNEMVEARMKDIEAEDKKVIEENENMETCEITEEETNDIGGSGIEGELPVIINEEIEEILSVEEKEIINNEQ